MSPKLHIQRLTIYENEQAVATRWVQDEQGNIWILLSQSAAASQTLELKASLDEPKNGAYALPTLELEGMDLAADDVRIYRLADVQVRVQRKLGFVAADNPSTGEFAPQFGRLVAELHRQLPAAPNARQEIAVTSRPVSSQTIGRLLTLVRRQTDGWSAEVECRLHCQAGQLDAFRLEIPPEWLGPFEITPAVEHHLVTIPGQSRRHLLIRPPRAIAGDFQVHIRGHLNGSESSAVRVPNIQLLDVQQVARYLVVAGRADKQRIEWETNGLQAAPLSADDWSLAISPDDETFQVVAPRFEAAVKRIVGPTGQSRVPLVDVRAAWQSDRRVFGSATFDLEPAGLTHCRIELPLGHEMVGIFIEGVPADATREGERTWRVRLPLDQLRERIEVVYASRLPLDDASESLVHLSAPQIIGIPVERTLWSVYAPSSAAGTPESALAPASLLEQDLVRLEAVGQAISFVAATDVASMPADVVTRWYRPWSERFEALRREIARRLPTDAKGDRQLAERLKSLLAKRSASAEQLQGIVLEGPPQPSAVAREITGGSAANLPANEQRVIRFDERGAVENIQLQYPAQLGQHLGRSLALGGAILLASLAAWLLCRWSLLREWLAAMPQAALALVGIATWLILPGNMLGFAIVACALWAALRSAWRGRNLEPVATNARSRQHST
jgi:hypothetical protein